MELGGLKGFRTGIPCSLGSDSWNQEISKLRVYMSSQFKYEIISKAIEVKICLKSLPLSKKISVDYKVL